MYAQTLPLPKRIAHGPPIKLQQNLTFSKSRFGLCKSVSESRISSGSNCRLVVVRCGGSLEKMPEPNQGKEFDDGYYIRRCVELAKKVIGHTSPNPMVGCVIVKGGKIVGEGFHPKAGQPHAEMMVNWPRMSLEPCNHYGRTPPCTEALIKAKVRNVAIGIVDPNPIVASSGVKKLQEAGINVTVGVGEELCKRLNEAYIHYMLTKKPYVTLRYSMSLDGHLINQLDEEATECGGYYSKLLQEYDAIIVSSTALADKSSIPISKEPGANQPLKIMLSKYPNSLTQIPPLDSDIASKLLAITEKDTNVEPQTVHEGIQTLSFNKISLLEILEYCKPQGLCSSVILDLTGNNANFENILEEGLEQNLF